MTRKETGIELAFKDECYSIIGACFAVYQEKGCGFREPVYHQCLAIELELQRIPCRSKPPRSLTYRGRTLAQIFAPDFICFDKIIIEAKAVSVLLDEHRAQLLNYLSACHCELGLLVNFGHYPRLEYERLLPRNQSLADVYL